MTDRYKYSHIKRTEEHSNISLSDILSIDNGVLARINIKKLTKYLEESLSDSIPAKGYSFVYNSQNDCILGGDFNVFDVNNNSFADTKLEDVRSIELSNKNITGALMGDWATLINKNDYALYLYQKENPNIYGVFKLSNKTDIVCGTNTYSKYNVIVKDASGRFVNGKEYWAYVMLDVPVPVPVPVETDPTVPAHVKSITTQNITNWNNNLGSFTETDPTVPSHVKAITTENITNWNNKLGSYTETDTLSSILGRGNTSTLNAQIGGLTATNLQNANNNPVYNRNIVSTVGGGFGYEDKLSTETDEITPIVNSLNIVRNDFYIKRHKSGIKKICLNLAISPRTYVGGAGNVTHGSIASFPDLIPEEDVWIYSSQLASGQVVRIVLSPFGMLNIIITPSTQGSSTATELHNIAVSHCYF